MLAKMRFSVLGAALALAIMAGAVFVHPLTTRALTLPHGYRVALAESTIAIERPGTVGVFVPAGVVLVIASFGIVAAYVGVRIWRGRKRRRGFEVTSTAGNR